MGKKENYTHVLLKPEMARMRALSKAIGYDNEDLHRFRIGIQNTWSETAAGHTHLKQVTEAVRAGIWQAGGTPIEFGGYGGCPIALGMNGHRYDTPSRDIMAMDVETCSELHSFDGLVLISSCDKNVPAHLLAAARMNIPTVIVLGGPMGSGRFRFRNVDMSDLDPFSWACETDPASVNYDSVEEMTECLCPGPGACALMGTANTMQCISEALGMSLPGNATTVAGSGSLLRLAKQAGRAIVRLIDEDVKPSDIITPEAMENAIRILHAIGGGTNAVVHLLALSHELGMLDRVNLQLIEKLGMDTPCITPIKPSGPYHLEDLGEAGGIQGVMKRLGEKIHPSPVTVNGKTVGGNIEEARIRNEEIIRPLENPVFSEGLYVLHGNLADSAVVRPTVIAKSMHQVTGPARVFESMESCLDAIRLHKINPGDIIVLRYEGPKGGPGLTDVFKIMGYLVSLNLHESCAVISDGKVSGFAKGPFICQVTPEAAEGGTIALVHEGDAICIDLPARSLELLVSDAELAERRRTWKPNPPRVTKGLLTLYAKSALPATMGAGLPLNLDTAE
ncbi:dihydroxy-acid dehydratase [Breznakiella homolactica]|uniref:Dihydroxy-acid dehydratase n=1 Tax=Breznakiella homolactica TaxID=2798577 RepID=A0A7T8B9Z2_9SPIR|nr:dihydroxy-acid dehydratase [Breznakiella homolactica]QQO08435.1 dihydroxy-acid dehydratase [Breznakiella homolactica]